MAPPHAHTLIIGPGGGSDVLVALAAGAEKVTAVEMNPLMLRFSRHFGAAAGNLYDHRRSSRSSPRAAPSSGAATGVST